MQSVYEYSVSQSLLNALFFMPSVCCYLYLAEDFVYTSIFSTLKRRGKEKITILFSFSNEPRTTSKACQSRKRGLGSTLG